MRAFLIFILSALSVFAQAPPYLRNFFDTNTAPIVQATAGSNCFVTFTTTEPAGQVRTFRIDVPNLGAGTTNIFLIATNNLYFVNKGILMGNTQGWYYETIGITNYFRSLVAMPGLDLTTNADNLILQVIGSAITNINGTNISPGTINSNSIDANTWNLMTNSPPSFDANLQVPIDGTTGGVYQATIGGSNYFKMLVGGDAYGIKVYSNGPNQIILSNLYPNIFWFTNALGPSNANSTYTQYVAAGSISNNYNVSIRGLLQLYGYDGNVGLYSTQAFNEFWVGGPNFSNTYMGRYAGVNAAIASSNPPTCGGNVMIGYRAGYSNLIGEGNVVIGSHAGQNQRTAIGNVLIGEGVMTAVPTIENSGNTMIGWRVAKDYTTGTGNTLVGKYCANGFVNGTDNTSLGQGSCNIPVGDGNTVLGTAALTASARAYWNIAIGYQAGSAMWSSNNIIIGRASGLNMGGQSNIIIGGAAMIPPALHESSNNIIIGSFAAQGMYTGSCNVLIGDSIGMMNYGVPAGYALHSNIIIGLNHTPKMRWDPVDKWKFEDSLGVRYNLYPTQSVNIGYPSMLVWTNYFGTNTSEYATPPATNIQFRLLVPSNLVIIATNGAGFTSNTVVYGTTGDALVNVPFRSASSSTSAPAGDEFVTKNYVDTHGGTGAAPATLYVSSNYTTLLSGVTNLNFVGATITTNSTNAVITFTGTAPTTGFTNDAVELTSLHYTNTSSEYSMLRWEHHGAGLDFFDVTAVQNGQPGLAELYLDKTQFSLDIGNGTSATNSIFMNVWRNEFTAQSNNFNGQVSIGIANTNATGLRVDNWKPGGGGITTNLFEIYSNGIPIFVVRSNGNVGILKAAPTTALDVTGVITGSGNASLGGSAYGFNMGVSGYGGIGYINIVGSRAGDPGWISLVSGSDPPKDYPFTEIRFPMPFMLLVFPQSLVTSSFDYNCPFVAVATMVKGNHVKHPVFSSWGNIGCEADMISFAFPLFSKAGAFVWYAGFFPATGDISAIGSPDFKFEDDGRSIRQYLIEKRHLNEQQLDEAMQSIGDGMTEEQDKLLLEKVQSAAIKVIMASTARSEYISPSTLARKVTMRRDGTVEKEELWNPAFIGQHYKIRCETIPGDGTHASPRMHWRKGHWHHVVHGPQRSLRRLDWFEPVLVNPL